MPGVVCATMTYVIVLTVEMCFVRIALWEGLVRGEQWACLNLAVF